MTNHSDSIPVDFTPTYRALLGETQKMELYLVGAGGTGSALAGSLARILYQARQKGQEVSLTLIDPDTIEERNIGRQVFCQAEIGYPKASSLTLRLNAAFGLEARAILQPFELAMVLSGYNPSTTKKLLIGCVDDHRPRQELARTVEEGGGNVWWLDMGNAYHSGNIYLGNAARAEQIQVDETLRLCSGLPSPALQDPALLAPDPAPPEPACPEYFGKLSTGSVEGAALSCADLTLREEQSLMINTTMAAVAADYCYRWVLQGELMTMSTAVTLEPPAMTSRWITGEALRRVFE